MKKIKTSTVLIASTGVYALTGAAATLYLLDACRRLKYPYSVWATRNASTETRISGKEKRDRAIEVHAKRLRRVYDAKDGSTSDSVLAALRMVGTRTLLFDEIIPAMHAHDPDWWSRKPMA